MFIEPSQQLWTEIEALASIDGLAVYDIEMHASDKLRVFVRRAKPSDGNAVSESGVNSSDCAKLLRRLQTFFLAEGSLVGIDAEPSLEVSSPGVNRRLRTREQLADAIGERVKIIVEPSIAKSGTFVGMLREVSEESIAIELEVDGSAVTLPLHGLKKVHVDFKFE